MKTLNYKRFRTLISNMFLLRLEKAFSKQRGVDFYTEFYKNYLISKDMKTFSEFAKAVETENHGLVLELLENENNNELRAFVNSFVMNFSDYDYTDLANENVFKEFLSKFRDTDYVSLYEYSIITSMKNDILFYTEADFLEIWFGGGVIDELFNDTQRDEVIENIVNDCLDREIYKSIADFNKITDKEFLKLIEAYRIMQND